MPLRSLAALSLVTLLAACAASPGARISETPPPGYLDLLQDPELAAAPAAMDHEAAQNFLALPPAIRAHIDRDILPLDETERYEALRSWAFDEFTEKYEYDPSFTAALDDLPGVRKVNCFSFSNMFVAAARYAGIDAHFQLVDSPPEWDVENDTLITTQHINVTGLLEHPVKQARRTYLTVAPEETGTRIRAPGSDRSAHAYVVDLNPEIASDVYETRQISDRQALALFYSNKTVETMLAGDAGTAFHYARLAVDTDQRSAVAWHNLGVLFDREDRFEEAERAYHTALAFDPRSDSTLGNLEKIYRQQGKIAEADDIASRLRRNRQKNPYFHYALGKLWMEQGNYQNAMIFFEEAVDRKGDEELFYYALAEAQMGLGYYSRAERSLEYAKKHTRDQSLERYHEMSAALDAALPES